MRNLSAFVFVLCAAIVGCTGGDARVEMSAGDGLNRVADVLEKTIHEYHDEVSTSDDTREAAVTAAFIARVRNHAADEMAVDKDSEQFAAALAKIRNDREVEWDRRNAALDNVGIVREISKGLHKLAIASLTLNDELNRYLGSWIEAHQKASAEAQAASDQRKAQRQAQIQGFVQQALGVTKPAAPATAKQ